MKQRSRSASRNVSDEESMSFDFTGKEDDVQSLNKKKAHVSEEQSPYLNTQIEESITESKKKLIEDIIQQQDNISEQVDESMSISMTPPRQGVNELKTSQVSHQERIYGLATRTEKNTQNN